MLLNCLLCLLISKFNQMYTSIILDFSETRFKLKIFIEVALASHSYVSVSALRVKSFFLSLFTWSLFDPRASPT